MNNKIQIVLGLLALCGVFGFQSSAHAKAAVTNTEISDDSLTFDGDSSASGGGGGSGTSGTTSNTTTQAAVSGPVAIPCLNDKGAVVNASEDEVCKAVLPTCAALKADTEAKVKDLLSWKIWGYYKGKDIDLSKSGNVEGKVTLEGTDMAAPICSVVGQTLKNSGSTSDFEIKSQAIADKKSCGARPNVIANNGNHTFKLVYESTGGAGTQWISYMQGAYPWLIRKNAYDVLSSINADMSNLNEVLKTAQMSQDIQDTVAKMKTFSKGLSKEAKASCNQTASAQSTSLVTQCKAGTLSISDPVQRVCTLVKAQLAANEGALPNMIVYEIMQNRVYKQYDATFGSLLSFQNETIKNLTKNCTDTGGFLSLSAKTKLAKTASCYFGGKFCCDGDSNIREAPASGSCQSRDTYIMLSTGKVVNHTFGFLTSDTKKSVNIGFAAVVEKLIRHDVCGQNKITDESVCDKVAIASKPKGIQ